MQTASPFVTIHCPGCGAPRNVSHRQAKRAGLCRECLYPERRNVSDSHRRFWFNNHTDQELSLIVSDLVGRPVPAERIHDRRLALVASGVLQDTV